MGWTRRGGGSPGSWADPPWPSFYQTCVPWKYIQWKGSATTWLNEASWLKGGHNPMGNGGYMKQRSDIELIITGHPPDLCALKIHSVEEYSDLTIWNKLEERHITLWGNGQGRRDLDEAKIRKRSDHHWPSTIPMCLENTLSGRVLPLDYMKQVGWKGA